MSVIFTNSHEPELLSYRKMQFSAIQWGAILAGVIVGLSILLLLGLLGVASGLAVMDINQVNSVSADVPTVSKWAIAWQGVSMLISAFVGGFVAARMSGLLRKADGILHGFVAWGTTTLLFAILSMSAMGALFGGVFYTSAMVTNQQMTSKDTGPRPQEGALLSSLIERAGGIADQQDISPEDIQQLRQHINAGNRDAAINQLQQISNLSFSQASTVVDQALILTGVPEKASPQAREVANRTVESASAMTWGLFTALILSLGLGLAGGALGSISSRRKVHVHDV